MSSGSGPCRRVYPPWRASSRELYQFAQVPAERYALPLDHAAAFHAEIASVRRASRALAAARSLDECTVDGEFLHD